MNQVTGKIIQVSEARNFTTKGGDEGWNQKIILDCARMHNGKVYPNYVELEYTEKIDQACLQEVRVGNKVNCCFDVVGFLREDEDNGDRWVAQRLKCFKITAASAVPVEAHRNDAGVRCDG